MKKVLAIFVLAVACQFATAQAAAPAQTAKRACDVWISATNNGNYGGNVDKLKAGEACATYIRGVKDEMEGELAWGDDTHAKLIVGNWQDGVTTEQMIRVFVKYANDNPAMLNKPANVVLRQSAEAAGLYNYTPLAIGNTGNGAQQ